MVGSGKVACRGEILAGDSDGRGGRQGKRCQEMHQVEWERGQ
jgi:hypothetical protein